MSSANPTVNPRSESLRQRRSQNKNGGRRPAQMAHKPGKVQPVLVRNVSQPSRVVRGNTRTKQPRRTYYYSLGASGAELRLPALPVIQPGWRLLSGLLTIIFALGVYTILNHPSFLVSQIDLVGVQRLNPEEITEALEVTGRSIVEIQPELAAENLRRAYPELAEVQVSVAFPASVGVSVRERVPVLAWQESDETYWIDTDGVIIPANGEPAEPLLTIHSDAVAPLVALPPVELDEEGNPIGEQPTTLFGRQVEASFLHAAQNLTPYIPEGSELTFDAESGLGWTDPRGWRVFIGLTIENIDLKLAEYQAVVDALSQRGITPGLISVEHLHAPFYRMEQ